jgi:hypothetical protein
MIGGREVAPVDTEPGELALNVGLALHAPKECRLRHWP